MKDESRRTAPGGAGMTAKVQARLGPPARLVARRRHDEIVSTARDMEDLYFRMHEGDCAPTEASAAKG